ncbi:MAG: NAD/FAD-binding protein, partial [Deltaproteobacteria bacterium]
MKKIAVIGSGISGTSASYYLNKMGYDVYLFESGSYFGGHTNTIDLDFEGQRIPIDTGFLVHNDRTYPNLIDFFKELK